MQGQTATRYGVETSCRRAAIARASDGAIRLALRFPDRRVGRGSPGAGLQIVRRWTHSDESAKFLGGLINDAFQLFGAPGMLESTEI